MDKANWTPEEAVQLARELNNYGTHYRNAVACLYKMFTLTLSNYWRGKNYNIVAEYVNEHYDEFNSISNAMCVTIPSVIQSIASLQAEDGLGSVVVFNYDITDPTGADSAIGFELIPMTEETSDGSILLTQDIVNQYIDGSNDPSLIFYQERMEDYLNSYSNTLDQFSSIKEFNDALKSAYEAIETFKTFSSTAAKNIIEETKMRADVELGKITETDAETKDLAVTALNSTSPNDTQKTGSFVGSTASNTDTSSSNSTHKAGNFVGSVSSNNAQNSNNNSKATTTTSTDNSKTTTTTTTSTDNPTTTTTTTTTSTDNPKTTTTTSTNNPKATTTASTNNSTTTTTTAANNSKRTSTSTSNTTTSTSKRKPNIIYKRHGGSSGGNSR